MMLKSAVLGPVCVGAYQVVVWMFDPLGVHTALNDGKMMTLLPRITSATVNGGLWLLLAHALVEKKTKTAMILSPFACAFTFNQWIFWWWPHFLGEAAGTVEMQREHKAQLATCHHILPSSDGGNLVPDTEHTLLQPMSWIALYQVGELLSKLGVTDSDRTKMAVSGVFFSLLPLGFLVSSPTPSTELGPMLAVGQVAAAVFYLYSKLPK